MPQIDKERTEAGDVEIRVTDRRPRFSLDSPPSSEVKEPSSPERRYPSVLEELQTRAREAEAKLAEALDLLRRREAEAETFRVRLGREMERRARAQVERFLQDLLDVVDSLDRGVAAASETDPAALGDGLRRVREQFLSSLARQGVEPMQLIGSLFDPNVAEALAISRASDDQQDNQVVEELRRGYRFGGEVLRPAQVRVVRKAAKNVVPTEEEVIPGAE